jgi:hypothetical protein
VTRASKSAIPLTAAALLGAAALGGCGGGTTAVGAADLTRMRTEIATARTAAASANATGVLSALAALRRTVMQLHSRGALADDRARTLLIEIGQAQARVATDVPGTAAAGAPNAQGPDAAPPHDNGNGKDHGKALGLGKHGGDGGGNGGD